MRYPKGHDRNPMSAEEVTDKFRRLFAGYGTPRQAHRIIARVNRLEELDDVGELARSFVRRSRGRTVARALHDESRNEEDSHVV